MSVEYKLIVDTEHYSGNFEREMCAWMTGQVGECGVGKELARQAVDDMPAELLEWCYEHVAGEPDDHGCYRPVRICPTPGWFNDGFGNHWRDEDWGTEQVTERHAAACRQHAEDSVKGYAKEAQVQVRLEAKKHLKERLERGPSRCAAYQSVMIHLDEEPPEDVFQQMAERAFFFGREHVKGGKAQGRMGQFNSEPIPITCIRLVCRETVVIDREVLRAEPG